MIEDTSFDAESDREFAERFKKGMELTSQALKRILKNMLNATASFIATEEGIYIAERMSTDHQDLYNNMKLQGKTIIDGGQLMFLEDEVVVMENSTYLERAAEINISINQQQESRPKTVTSLQKLAGNSINVHAV